MPCSSSIQPIAAVAPLRSVRGLPPSSPRSRARHEVGTDACPVQHSSGTRRQLAFSPRIEADVSPHDARTRALGRPETHFALGVLAPSDLLPHDVRAPRACIGRKMPGLSTVTPWLSTLCLRNEAIGIRRFRTAKAERLRTLCRWRIFTWCKPSMKGALNTRV